MGQTSRFPTLNGTRIVLPCRAISHHHLVVSSQIWEEIRIQEEKGVSEPPPMHARGKTRKERQREEILSPFYQVVLTKRFCSQSSFPSRDFRKCCIIRPCFSPPKGPSRALFFPTKLRVSPAGVFSPLLSFPARPPSLPISPASFARARPFRWPARTKLRSVPPLRYSYRSIFPRRRVVILVRALGLPTNRPLRVEGWIQGYSLLCRLTALGIAMIWACGAKMCSCLSGDRAIGCYHRMKRTPRTRALGQVLMCWHSFGAPDSVAPP